MAKSWLVRFADGQPATTLERREQVVARIVQMHRLLRVRRVDDAVEHRQRLPARDATTQVRLQHLVVHGREVPVDVAPQNVAMTVAQPLVARQRPVRPLPRPVGVGVVDEAAREQRRDHRVHGVVHHPVAERRGRDRPALRIADLERDVAAGPPCYIERARRDDPPGADRRFLTTVQTPLVRHFGCNLGRPCQRHGRYRSDGTCVERHVRPVVIAAVDRRLPAQAAWRTRVRCSAGFRPPYASGAAESAVAIAFLMAAISAVTSSWVEMAS